MKIRSKWIKIGLWSFFFLIMVVIAGSHILDGIMQYDDHQVKEFFRTAGMTPEIHYLDAEGNSVRVIRAGKGEKDVCILFSHGAPGSWDAFKDYMVDGRILDMTDVISYDRPGYGGSSLGNAVTSLDAQAGVVQAIRDEYGYRQYILVSHSYGGPVMTWNAIDHPEGVAGNILIAPAIDPYTEKFFWFSGLSYWGWSRWLWPMSFQVAGDEKYTHPYELQKLEQKMEGLLVPTLLIHSLDDAIAPADGNIAFLQEHVADSLLSSEILEDKGHLVVWTDRELVTDLILAFIEDQLLHN